MSEELRERFWINHKSGAHEWPINISTFSLFFGNMHNRTQGICVVIHIHIIPYVQLCTLFRDLYTRLLDEHPSGTN